MDSCLLSDVVKHNPYLNYTRPPSGSPLLSEALVRSPRNNADLLSGPQLLMEAFEHHALIAAGRPGLISSPRTR